MIHKLIRENLSFFVIIYKKFVQCEVIEQKSEAIFV